MRYARRKFIKRNISLRVSKAPTGGSKLRTKYRDYKRNGITSETEKQKIDDTQFDVLKGRNKSRNEGERGRGPPLPLPPSADCTLPRISIRSKLSATGWIRPRIIGVFTSNRCNLPRRFSSEIPISRRASIPAELFASRKQISAFNGQDGVNGKYPAARSRERLSIICAKGGELVVYSGRICAPIEKYRGICTSVKLAPRTRRADVKENTEKCNYLNLSSVKVLLGPSILRSRVRAVSRFEKLSRSRETIFVSWNITYRVSLFLPFSHFFFSIRRVTLS